MLSLPPTFIVFDTEFTTWEGARERNWTGPNEHREIVQLAAARVLFPKLSIEETFIRFIRPVKNPQLSEYFIALTGITQEQIETKGVVFPQAIKEFAVWSGSDPLYCYGTDFDYLAENCRLLEIPWPFALSRFANIKDTFKTQRIAADQYMSSTIVEAFGVTPTRRGHDALNDVKTIVDGLKLLQIKLDRTSD